MSTPLADAGRELLETKAAPSSAKLLDDSDVAALFGLEMAEFAAFETTVCPRPSGVEDWGNRKKTGCPL